MREGKAVGMLGKECGVAGKRVWGRGAEMDDAAPCEKG